MSSLFGLAQSDIKRLLPSAYTLHFYGHLDQSLIKRIPQVLPQPLALIKSFN